MMADKNIKLTSDIMQQFADYKKLHPVWGSLHVALDDDNLKDASIQFCLNEATRTNDTKGVILAKYLLTMTKSQRARVSAKTYALIEANHVRPI